MKDLVYSKSKCKYFLVETARVFLRFLTVVRECDGFGNVDKSKDDVLTKEYPDKKSAVMGHFETIDELI